MTKSRSTMILTLILLAVQGQASGKVCASVEDPTFALVVTVTDATGNTNINPTVSVEHNGVAGDVTCDFEVTATSCIDWLATPAEPGTFVVHVSAPGFVASDTSVDVGTDEIGRVSPQWVRITLVAE